MAKQKNNNDENYILKTYGVCTDKINKLPTMDLTKNFYSLPYFSLGCFGDIPSYIATIKFEELERMYRTARYGLIKGSHSKHEGITSTGGNDIAQLWVRFGFLKNAIIWYNSCYDYILLIIYFHLNFKQLVQEKTMNHL